MPSKHTTLHCKTWVVVSEAVSLGVAFGLMRYQKQTTKPLSKAALESLRDQLNREVMNALTEVVNLDD